MFHAKFVDKFKTQYVQQFFPPSKMVPFMR